jgi:dihydrofolate reductase
MRISAIVAMSENRVIGKDNRLPWSIPEDLKRFRKLTLGHSIIMGRKTFDSIYQILGGRILDGRLHWILTRQKNYQDPRVRIISAFEEAVSLCKEKKEDEIFVIGGAEVYQLALPQLDRLYLTLIHQFFEGDTYFPEFEKETFQEVTRQEFSQPIPYSFLVLDRKSAI